MKRYFTVLLFSVIFLSSCATLIKDEEIDVIKKYEEGIRIYKQCHDIINSAELKIKVLNDDNCDGGI